MKSSFERILSVIESVTPYSGSEEEQELLLSEDQPDIFDMGNNSEQSLHEVIINPDISIENLDSYQKNDIDLTPFLYYKIHTCLLMLQQMQAETPNLVKSSDRSYLYFTMLFLINIGATAATLLLFMKIMFIASESIYNYMVANYRAQLEKLIPELHAVTSNFISLSKIFEKINMLTALMD